MKKILAISVLAVAVFPILVLADETYQLENPLESESFAEVMAGVLNFVWYIAIAVVPIMLILAGFYFVTAAGDSNKIKTAKDILLWTLLGFGLIALSKGIVQLVMDILGVEQEGGGGTFLKELVFYLSKGRIILM